MSTEYKHRVTIVVPEALMAEANQLALCLGESAADDRTFESAHYEDSEGNQYAVASTVVKPVFLDMAGSPLRAPDHAPGVDLTAAKRAQELLVIGDRINGGTPVTVGPDVGPDHIAVILDHRLADVQEHIAALGLTPAVSEDEEEVL